jgi:SAM-dependent methyltransferase
MTTARRRVLRALDATGLLRVGVHAWENVVALAHLREPRSPGSQRTKVDGGLPLPPRRLMVGVGWSGDADWFLQSGRALFESVVSLVPVAAESSILDFGCGCGRVTRYWADHPGAVVGSDFDARAIKWCRRNLPFASFECNRLAPPLPFSDATFDLVYALSVFTHFTAELQLAWRDELRRVLRPGGHLLITTHGASIARRLESHEQSEFERGELVVRWKNAAGSNLCSAYHPEQYLRQTLSRGFDLLEFEPEGAPGHPRQDLAVLRKPVAAPRPDRD